MGLAFLLAIAFCTVLVTAGCVFARRVLQIDDGAAVTGLAPALGVAVYLLLANSFAYVMPVREAFIVSLALLALCAAPGFFPTSSQRRLIWPSRRMILWIVSLALIAGYAYVRDRGSDEWTWSHYPLAATIMGGNFPVLEPANPWMLTGYHYGTSLFVAALSFLTGISLASAQALLSLLGAWVVVWCAWAMGFRLVKSEAGALLIAALALGGAGFFWLRGVFFLQDLWAGVASIPAGETIFRWVTPTIRNLPAQGLLPMLGHKPTALGAAFLFPVLLLLQRFLNGDRKKWGWIAAGCFVLLTQMALTIESSMVVLFLAFAAYTVISLFQSKLQTWGAWIMFAALASVPALFVALIQGGPLTQRTGSVGASAFSFNTGMRLPLDAGIDTLTVGWGDGIFWRDLGLPLLFFAVATLWLVRRRMARGFVLLLLLLAWAHVLMPLVVWYAPYPPNMFRFFWIGFPMAFLFGGAFLWQAGCAASVRWKRVVAWLFIACVLAAATLNLLVRLTFPTLRLTWSPLWPMMPVLSSGITDTAAWAKEHTTIADRFYLYDEDTPPMVEQRIMFSYAAERFVVGSANVDVPAPRERALLDRMLRCDVDAFAMLETRFLVVPSPAHAAWFTERCDPSRWDILFNPTDAAHPRVYGLRS